METSSTLVTNMTSCLVCANMKCLAHRRAVALQLCSGCAGVAYCGEECQKEGWGVHRVVCSKMKGVSWEEKVKQIRAMISLAREGDYDDQSSPTRGVLGTEEEEEVATPPVSPSAPPTPNQARPDQSWDLSPVREASGAIKTFCLLRFSCLSPVTWRREVDVIVVKVWQDMELTSIGVFLPAEEEETGQKVAFKIFSNGGKLINEQEEDVEELFVTDIEKMGEMRLSAPVKLSAHRRYFLVVKMGGMACWVGEGGSYLHCLQTEVGGVQVIFETPASDELEEFLEEAENDTNTVRGQIPALYLRKV